MGENKGLTWPQIRYWLTCAGLILFGGAATIWGGPWDAIRPTSSKSLVRPYLSPGLWVLL
jgi:hypothetical protein